MNATEENELKELLNKFELKDISLEDNSYEYDESEEELLEIFDILEDDFPEDFTDDMDYLREKLEEEYERKEINKESSVTKRWKIVFDVLAGSKGYTFDDQKGLSYANKEFDCAGIRRLSVRQPYELVAVICLHFNDLHPETPIDLMTFRSIVRNLNLSKLNKKKESESDMTDPFSVSNGITLASLEKYLSETSGKCETDGIFGIRHSSDNAGAEAAYTGNETYTIAAAINSRMDNAESEEDIEALIKKLIEQTDHLELSCERCRWYYNKYLFLFLVSCVATVCKIFKMIAGSGDDNPGMSVEEFKKWINDNPNPDSSLERELYAVMSETAEMRRVPVVGFTSGDIQDALSDGLNARITYIEFINKLAFLKGGATRGNKLFSQKSADTYYFSDFKANTSVFNGDTRKRDKLHKELQEAINKLTLEDYKHFSIDWVNLGYLLLVPFNKNVSESMEDINVSQSEKDAMAERLKRQVREEAKERIRGIVTGKREVSKASLLQLLIIAYMFIDYENEWVRAYTTDRDRLNLNRVNYILRRCGFGDLNGKSHNLLDKELESNSYHLSDTTETFIRYFFSKEPEDARRMLEGFLSITEDSRSEYSNVYSLLDKEPLYGKDFSKETTSNAMKK